MRDDDRFDEIIDRLAGFYGSWLAYLGLELGLFAAIRTAGNAGITPRELAAATGTDPRAVETWAWAADAHRLVDFDDARLTIDPEMAAILLDVDRPDHLGGQVVHAVVASMDWSAMPGFFRSGTPVRDRPDRYRAAIERLTYQDIAVFFQEVLGALPQLVADLARGGRVIDVHCGGGRWLMAMARRFGSLELIGIESELDSVDRARAAIATAGLSDRIRIEAADPTSVADAGPADLVYLQYALHLLPDPVDVLRASWRSVRPGGRIVVLDWPLPETADEFRTRYGELIVGIQLDELFQGTALATRDRFLSWFEEAGLPAPTAIELPSGAMALVMERSG